jgi:hypothetical protein
MAVTWEAIGLIERLRAALEKLGPDDASAPSGRGELVVLRRRANRCIRALNAWPKKPPTATERHAVTREIESLCLTMKRLERRK